MRPILIAPCSRLLALVLLASPCSRLLAQTSQDVDEKSSLSGTAIDAANDFLLVRDASVASGPALKKLPLDEFIDIPGFFGSVSKTELLHLDGVTSAIQTQINAKQATLVSGTTLKTINSTSLLGSGNISTVPTNDDVNTAIASNPGAIRGTLDVLDESEMDAAIDAAFTNGAVNTAISANVSATHTALNASTTGGTSNLWLSDPDGNWTTGDYSDPSNSVFGGGVGNIYIPDRQGIEFLRADGTKSGQAIQGWDDHGGSPGTPELILKSPERIALAAYKGIQVGVNDSGRYPRYLQLVSGYSLGGYSGALTYMPSGVVRWQTSVWDGDSNNVNEIMAQAHALDTTGTNSELVIYDQASINEAGNNVTAGRGDVSGNRIARIHNDGIWSNGTAPVFEQITDSGGFITQECSEYKTVQSATTVLDGNHTLTFSGLEAGMRGVIYVSQPASGGPWDLTPTEGTALDLSDTAGYTDRVVWEYDGVYINFSTQKNVSKLAIVTDSDAQTFITQASITDNTQKAAVNRLVQDLKEANLWTKFFAIYPFVGGTATAHGQDLKGTYDIVNIASSTWTADVTHNSNGITGNGTSGFGDTGLDLASVSALSAFLHVTCRTQSPTDGRYLIGAVDSNTMRVGLYRNGAFLGGAGLNANNVTPVTASTSNDFRRHLWFNRTGASAQTIGFNATSTSGTIAAGTACSKDMLILARSFHGFPNDLFSNANLSFTGIATNMSAGDVTAYLAIVDAFQTSLGRNN